MRKKVKKFLRKGAGVILTLVMLLTLVNINGLTAYAEGEETAEDEPAGDALWFWYVSDSGEFTAMGTPELPTEKVSALVEKDSGYELTQYDTYDAAIGENAKVIYDPENPKKLTLNGYKADYTSIYESDDPSIGEKNDILWYSGDYTIEVIGTCSIKTVKTVINTPSDVTITGNAETASLSLTSTGVEDESNEYSYYKPIVMEGEGSILTVNIPLTVDAKDAPEPEGWICDDIYMAGSVVEGRIIGREKVVSGQLPAVYDGPILEIAADGRIANREGEKYPVYYTVEENDGIYYLQTTAADEIAMETCYLKYDKDSKTLTLYNPSEDPVVFQGTNQFIGCGASELTIDVTGKWAIESAFPVIDAIDKLKITGTDPKTAELSLTSTGLWDDGSPCPAISMGNWEDGD